MSSSKRIAAENSFWYEVPSDAWASILSRVELEDVINFSNTCSSWYRVCVALEMPLLKSGKPMLITSRPVLDGSRKERQLDGGRFGLHDICERKSFIWTNELLGNKIWIGGKGNWVVTTDRYFGNMNILDPLTGDLVPLPPLHTGTSFGDGIPAYCRRRLSRVVLAETPSCLYGHVAIALFSGNVLAYTSASHNGWIRLRNPVIVDGWCSGKEHVFIDAINHKGNVVAVARDGCVYTWVIGSPDPIQLKTTTFADDELDEDCAFYLATSPSNEIILITIHGQVNNIHIDNDRVIISEHDLFAEVSRITLDQYDDTLNSWRAITTIGDGKSLFLGLNYPFYGTWMGKKPDTGIRPDSVYITNLVYYDFVVFSLRDEGKLCDARDYPEDKDARLVDGFSMRTPMWFRPIAASRRKLE